MTLRILGLALFLLGAVLAGLGTHGAVRGPSMTMLASALSDPETVFSFDFGSWLRRWQLWGAGIASAGGALAVGGIAVALRRRWGLVLVAITFLAAAIVPWVMHALGLTRYPYERADLAESCVYLLLSALAAFGYRQQARTRD